jgi:hypothetical protein
MSLTLTRQQMLALVLLAFFTVLVLGYLVLATVAHVDVWHMLTSSTHSFLATMSPH